MKKIDKYGSYYGFANRIGYHRVGLPAYFTDENNDKEWFFNNHRHRVNGRSYPIYDYIYLYNVEIRINIDKLVI